MPELEVEPKLALGLELKDCVKLVLKLLVELEGNSTSRLLVEITLELLLLEAVGLDCETKVGPKLPSDDGAKAESKLLSIASRSVVEREDATRLVKEVVSWVVEGASRVSLVTICRLTTGRMDCRGELVTTGWGNASARETTEPKMETSDQVASQMAVEVHILSEIISRARLKVVY